MTAPHQPPSQRQVAMVFDLNKCMGCQTCTVACKMIWTREAGEEHQWWCTVNTQPGLGTPKGWERMGGGYGADGKPVPGQMPVLADFGGGWQFNHAEVFFAGKGRSAHLTPSAPGGAEPAWGPNWDEDQGGGEYPNSYYFYLPRLCNHCTRPVALPLHPEFGTEPNVFYVPPLSPHRLNDDLSIDDRTPRIPPAYLESLFGPKVHAALDTLRAELATVRTGGKSEILDTLIVYRWQELFGPFTKPPAGVPPLYQGGGQGEIDAEAQRGVAPRTPIAAAVTPTGIASHSGRTASTATRTTARCTSS